MFVSDVGELKINQAFLGFKKNGENIYFSMWNFSYLFIVHQKNCISITIRQPSW